LSTVTKHLKNRCFRRCGDSYLLHVCVTSPKVGMKNFYSKTNYMHQFLKFILFWNNILHLSDGLSVHHQEFKTVHTASGICQTDTATCLKQPQNRYDIYLMLYVQSWTPDYGRKDRPKHVECYSEMK